MSDDTHTAAAPPRRKSGAYARAAAAVSESTTEGGLARCAANGCPLWGGIRYEGIGEFTCRFHAGSAPILWPRITADIEREMCEGRLLRNGLPHPSLKHDTPEVAAIRKRVNRDYREALPIEAPVYERQPGEDDE